jgi:hypothetical protein
MLVSVANPYRLHPQYGHGNSSANIFRTAAGQALSAKGITQPGSFRMRADHPTMRISSLVILSILLLRVAPMPMLPGSRCIYPGKLLPVVID